MVRRWDERVQIIWQVLSAPLPLLLAVLGVAVTLWPPTTDTQKLIWLGIFVLVGIAALIVVLQQQQADRRTRRREFAAHKSHAENIEKIRANLAEMARFSASDADPYSNIKTITNRKLVELALSIASEMRAFEAAHQSSDHNNLYRSWRELVHTENEEVRSALFRRENEFRMSRHSEMERQFKTQFLQHAFLIRNELCSRLNISVPGRHTSSNEYAVALDAQMLAGVNPIGDAAAVIENLARQLT